VTNSNIVLMKW